MSLKHALSPSFLIPATRLADSRPPENIQTRVAVACFGAPLERTMSFRSGAADGPTAIREMSWSLESYSPVLNRDTLDLSLLDLGDLDFTGASMEESIDTVAAAMEHAASISCLPIMLGGEHTVSLGGYRGIKRVYPDAVLLQLDAHADMRTEYEGIALTHASWVYHAGCEWGFDIVQLGLRSGERQEWSRAHSHTMWSSPALDLSPALRSLLADKPVYLTVDIDVLDPAYAPGTGSPEPGGATFDELIHFLYSLAGLNVVGLDVVEVAPELDPSGITAVAAAKVIREVMLMFGMER